MNLKHFKKVHDDEEKAILQNHKGHEITVAKKALTAKQRADLESLHLYKAEGGSADSDKNKRKEFETGINREEERGVSEGGQYLRRGNKEYAKSYQREALNESKKMPKPKMNFDDGGEAGQPDDSDDDSSNAPSGMAQDVSQALPNAAPDTTTNQTAMPQAQSQNSQQVYSQAYNDYVAQHAQQFGQEAAAYDQDLNNGHVTPETYKSLFAKKDTLGKVGTLFGLLASGAGSGLSHQSNMVLGMMDKEIDRDLEAQKLSKENALNYYRLNQQNELQKAQIQQEQAQTSGKVLESEMKMGAAGNSLLDNDTRAIIHAKNQMILGAVHNAQGIVNNYPNSPQKIQAMQALQGVKQAAAAHIQQNNIKGAQAIANNPDGNFQKNISKLTGMELAGIPGAEAVRSQMQSQHVPGFGDSTQPIPGDVRQELVAKRDYDGAAKRYVQFAKEHQKNWQNLDPASRLQIAKQGAVLGAELQGKYRNKTHGGVYKEGEQHFIQTIIPDNATSWAASFNQIPKVEQTIFDNEQDTKALANGYGLPFSGFGGNQKPKSSATKEGATGTFNGKPVIFKGGKWSYK